jgi:hypothetical protein
MRWAFENQLSEQDAVKVDQDWWRTHRQSRSESSVDDAAGLAW